MLLCDTPTPCRSWVSDPPGGAAVCSGGAGGDCEVQADCFSNVTTWAENCKEGAATMVKEAVFSGIINRARIPLQRS